MAQPQSGPPPGAPGQGGPQGGPQFKLQNGQQPTPEQIRQMQAQLAAEAQKAGVSVEEYVNRMKQHMMQQQQQQQRLQQQHAQGAKPGQQVPIQPGPPKPEAIAMAKFLQGQDLKQRTCIFQEQRKDMFKVKRALRALHSEAYKKACKKNPLLPEVHDRVTAENAFKLLPMSLLALRVNKMDEEEGHEGHNHAKKKKTKGLWTVKVEPQQEAADEMYYVWLYAGSQWKTKAYAGGALALILAVVFFPVWPIKIRIGVWYLSMAMLGVLGLFFTMAFFRLILFLVTFFTTPPGLWLYPNLFEDVGFFDSFKPVWAWHESEVEMKKRKKQERDRKKERRAARARGELPEGEKSSKKSKVKQQEPTPVATVPAATGSQTAPSEGLQQRGNMNARVEEVEDE